MYCIFKTKDVHNCKLTNSGVIYANVVKEAFEEQLQIQSLAAVFKTSPREK